MSQHDFSIANQGFPSFRADLNSGLEALATNSSGATAPTTTYAYQFWYDTANDLLKLRNSDNDAWITLAAFDQANDQWQVRSAVIQAVDSDGISLKTDDGTTRLSISDAGVVDVNGTFTASRGVGDTDISSISGATTLDFSANQNFVLTLTGNVTLSNPTTETVGQSGFITFIQDGTGGRTVSLGSEYETAGGAGLTLSSAASATDVVPYIVAASGRVILGTPTLAVA